MTSLQEPESLPMPEFPYPLGHRLAGCVRWSCPERCGWHHDEWPGLEPGRIELPADVGTEGKTFREVLAACSPEDIGRGLTASATRREDARRERVLAALAEHRRSAHSDHASGADSSSPLPDAPRTVGHCDAPLDSPLWRGVAMPGGEQ